MQCDLRCEPATSLSGHGSGAPAVVDPSGTGRREEEEEEGTPAGGLQVG